MSFEEFLRWLDVIPGRRWLLIGAQSAEPIAVYRPSAVDIVEGYVESLPYRDGSFDVAAAVDPGNVISSASPDAILSASPHVILSEAKDLTMLVTDMRRVTWPGGTIAVLSDDEHLEPAFRAAGLHAIQVRPGAAKGTR